MPTVIRRNGKPVARDFPVQKLPNRVTTGQKAAQLTVPVGWALLRADDDPSLSVVCELGERKPVPTAGYGGVDQVERARRTALTPWKGFAAFEYEMDLVLDGTATRASVEPAKEVLEALAGRGHRATGGEPPKVLVNTAGVMAHDWTRSPETRWWVNDLDWSTDEDDVERDGANDILATVTVTLLQVVDTSGLADRALTVATRLAQQGKGAKRTYVVKEGETLITIARDKLGDPGRWLELADLNDVRDPRGVRRGATIRLP